MIARRHAAASTWLIALVALAPNAHGEGPAPTRRPNIVIMLADDLGQRDLGCYGSELYETPHLDRMASEGVRFTDAYASCPVCSPSRAALLTGKSPARIGLTSHVGDVGPDRWSRGTPLVPAPSIDRLPLEEVTLAEVLHDAGYATLHAGKWHLGHEPFFPEYQGFDVNHGGWSQGGPFTGKGYFSPYGNPRLSDGPPGENLTARLAEETARFIHAHRHEPFFIHLAWYDVHAPIQAPEAIVAKYEAKFLALEGEVGAMRTTPDGKERVRQDHAVYAAMVESLDRGVGHVLQALKEAGIDERTIVVFTSDNGGLSTGDAALPPEQGWPTTNAPLRAGKGWLYEGGVRVPLMVRPPGGASRGGLSHRVVTGADLFATTLRWAGVEHPSPADSSDFSAAMAGDETPRPAAFWHYPHYGNQGGRPGAAVREGDWKLIEWYAPSNQEPDVELYDLASDPGEHKDLAAERPQIREKLLASLRQWLEESGAVMPTDPSRVASRRR